MATKGEIQPVLGGDERKSIAMPCRRSARQQTRTGLLGSSSQPILIPDSPPSIISQLSVSQSDPVEVPQNPSSIALLPFPLLPQLPGHTKRSIKLLHKKQQQLQSPKSQIHQLPALCDPKTPAYPTLKEAVGATLVFAQEEAGTAVCISREGSIITCSHCVAESAEELDMERVWWLIFADGRVVQAKTVKWDVKRDLALLHIVSAQKPQGSVSLRQNVPLHQQSHHGSDHSEFAFPYATIAKSAPKPNTKLLCIGHPGSEDLETSRAGVKTGYDVLHISTGRFRSYAKVQDIQDNSEIGALMHDCWTYWGHSGAPLLEVEGGGLVGMHSSWDEETGMRRGVGWEALRAFLGDFEKKRVE